MRHVKHHQTRTLLRALSGPEIQAQKPQKQDESSKKALVAKSKLVTSINHKIILTI